MSLHQLAGEMLAQADTSTTNPKQIGVGLSVAFSIAGYIAGQWHKGGKGKRSDAQRTAMLWFTLGAVMILALGLALRGMR
ncbi:hypothetical protein OG948_21335 [Embleya sp. NBC_00888]|uniref:hypothetical protein n=1 Tax=Embleya sp. NBC_00888 TaxID=2975960 RepID=UPI00386504F7|nr:hypothetical protein OG948_21335 [Embleya sp. NBC_00888]